METAVNFSELRRRILIYYNTMAEFAEAINLSPTTLSNKLNKKTPWRLDEITLICNTLEISKAEIPFYFLETK